MRGNLAKMILERRRPLHRVVGEGADLAFLADVKARKLEAEPDFGEQLEVIAKEAVNQPREVVDRMKKLLGD